MRASIAGNAPCLSLLGMTAGASAELAAATLLPKAASTPWVSSLPVRHVSLQKRAKRR